MPEKTGRTTDRPQPADKRKTVPHYKPTKKLVLFLANKLIQERAKLLRLENYVTGVVGAELPEDTPIFGVESVDFREYWDSTARTSLHEDEEMDWDEELRDTSPSSDESAQVFPFVARTGELGGPPAVEETAKDQFALVSVLLKMNMGE